MTCTSHVYFPALMNGRENLHPLLEDLRAGLQKGGNRDRIGFGSRVSCREYMLSLIERGDPVGGRETGTGGT